MISHSEDILEKDNDALYFHQKNPIAFGEPQ